ncbi:MAG: FG-GAP repeat protein [Thermoanaerobaculia bacterium]|nr:FG-GAP repeat protein [Thermoanaerobaculia bacterium]
MRAGPLAARKSGWHPRRLLRGYFYDAHRGIPGNPFWLFDHYWGKAMAAGDFDGDGAEDLAVGAPDEYEFMGAVTILYGSLFSDGFESQNFNAWSSHVP